MLPIEKKLIRYNRTISPRRLITYIVIHDTGNKAKGANAYANYSYFNGGDRQASADFFVDCARIIQCVEIENNYSWAVGDGQGKYGITNQNSVSIEICVNSDGMYDIAVSNAVDLAAYLLKKYNLPLS